MPSARAGTPAASWAASRAASWAAAAMVCAVFALFACMVVCPGGAAIAQTKPPTTQPITPPVTPSATPGSASVATQLRALHYGNVRDLRRGPDGQWTGTATRNGIDRTVTVSPKGVVTAR